MIHDNDLLDSVALLALGTLSAGEAKELAAHVSTCDTCRREYAELRETAAIVGYAAELSVDLQASRGRNRPT